MARRGRDDVDVRIEQSGEVSDAEAGVGVAARYGEPETGDAGFGVPPEARRH